jgi:hypothetical protein
MGATSRFCGAIVLIVAVAGCDSASDDRAASTNSVPLESLVNPKAAAPPAAPPATAAPPAAPSSQAVATSTPAAPAAASKTSAAASLPTGMDRYPRRPDGSPDFEKYVLDLYREGVTPENNAAVLMWAVLWPEEQSLLMRDEQDEIVDSQGRKQTVAAYLAEKHGRFYQELGLPGVPPKADVLRSVSYGENRKRVEEWMAGRGARRSAPARRGSFPQMFSSEADAIIDPALTHPWTSAAIPPLAEWVRENERALDQIVLATKRPRYYAPYSGLLNDPDEPAIAWLMPQVQEARNVARGLSTRAMWHLGEGRPEQAWQDILAMHRLARLVAQQRTLVDQHVAVAIDGMASNATITLLSESKLSGAQARVVLQDLLALSYFQSIPDSIDTVERAMLLDIVLRVRSGRTSAKEFNFDGDLLDLISSISARNSNLDHVRAAGRQVSDWDAVLARCNQFYDRLVAAARMPAGAARKVALANIEAELAEANARRPDSATSQQLRSFASLPADKRSAVFASAMIGLLAPAVRTTTSVQDRANTTLDITRLAAALTVYRVERGQYPDKLDDLVPGTLATLPVDAFNAKPFNYRRDGAGYILYSLGANGNDDDGFGPFELARDTSDRLNTSQPARRPTQPRPNSDDLTLRLPLPAFEFPK